MRLDAWPFTPPAITGKSVPTITWTPLARGAGDQGLHSLQRCGDGCVGTPWVQIVDTYQEQHHVWMVYPDLVVETVQGLRVFRLCTEAALVDDDEARRRLCL